MISPQKMQLEEFKTFGKCHLERGPTLLVTSTSSKSRDFNEKISPWNASQIKILDTKKSKKNEDEKLMIWKLCRSYVRWLRRKRLGSKLWGYFLSISSNVFLVNLIKHVSCQFHKWIFLLFLYFFVNLISSILSFLN